MAVYVEEAQRAAHEAYATLQGLLEARPVQRARLSEALGVTVTDAAPEAPLAEVADLARLSEDRAGSPTPPASSTGASA